MVFARAVTRTYQQGGQAEAKGGQANCKNISKYPYKNILKNFVEKLIKINSNILK